MQVMRIKIMVIISLVIIIINKSENVNYNSSIKSYQELLLSKKKNNNNYKIYYKQNFPPFTPFCLLTNFIRFVYNKFVNKF